MIVASHIAGPNLGLIYNDKYWQTGRSWPALGDTVTYATPTGAKTAPHSVIALPPTVHLPASFTPATPVAPSIDPGKMVISMTGQVQAATAAAQQQPAASAAAAAAAPAWYTDPFTLGVIGGGLVVAYIVYDMVFKK